MAAIDKIYGTRKQWNRLHAFLFQTKIEYIEKYMYTQPEVEGPIANFSKEANEWLWENCPLDFVRERLAEQYPHWVNEKQR
jgi:hypothetical protein